MSSLPGHMHDHPLNMGSQRSPLLVPGDQTVLRRAERRNAVGPMRLLDRTLNPRRRRRISGFTMIELVGVLTILVILLASIVGAYLGWGQAGAIDGATDMLTSGLAHARELAITRRDSTGIICGNATMPGHAARGYFVLVRNSVTNTVDPQVVEDLAPTNYLPGDVQFRFPFADNGQPVIRFTMEGRAYAPPDSPLDPNILRFELFSPRGEHPLSRYVIIDPLTGIASVVQKE